MFVFTTLFISTTRQTKKNKTKNKTKINKERKKERKDTYGNLNINIYKQQQQHDAKPSQYVTETQKPPPTQCKCAFEHQLWGGGGRRDSGSCIVNRVVILILFSRSGNTPVFANHFVNLSQSLQLQKQNCSARTGDTNRFI